MAKINNLQKVLFVTSEAHPLIKTGGLGDVAGSLPAALAALGCDVRLVIPAYPEVLSRTENPRLRLQFSLPTLQVPISLLEGVLPGSKVKTWLIDYPPAFGRPGNPYLDENGEPWDDNAGRFAVLGHAVTTIALNRIGLQWQPDVVHCNDWQTGLAPALLSREAARPATLFTIHNLAYQGLFSFDTFEALGLPPDFRSMHGLEFHSQISFIKGGLAFSDKLTTVSPTYAREIQTPEFGCGLDGLLRHRAADLTGILNGIDYLAWDPAHDPFLAKQYDRERFRAKAANRTALRKEFKLAGKAGRPVIGFIGRLVEQKGIDLILDAMPGLLQLPLQLVVLGSGESSFENALRQLAARNPGRIGVHIGFDEALAHRIEAGADMFLMPSRFEPCGLNQLYSLRYGAVPIVRRTGGLADTVIDATPEHLADGSATGIVFHEATADALVAAISRALEMYREKATWKTLALTGMAQVYDWRRSAEQYLRLYAQACYGLRARAR